MKPQSWGRQQEIVDGGRDRTICPRSHGTGQVLREILEELEWSIQSEQRLCWSEVPSLKSHSGRVLCKFRSSHRRIVSRSRRCADKGKKRTGRFGKLSLSPNNLAPRTPTVRKAHLILNSQHRKFCTWQLPTFGNIAHWLGSIKQEMGPGGLTDSFVVGPRLNFWVLLNCWRTAETPQDTSRNIGSNPWILGYTYYSETWTLNLHAVLRLEEPLIVCMHQHQDIAIYTQWFEGAGLYRYYLPPNVWIRWNKEELDTRSERE